MPIYAYRCTACGHAKDVLQKMSDPVLVECPACGASALAKQVTAAGFQLKGSGWYATDFKGGAPARAEGEAKAETAADGKPADKADAAKGEPAKAESSKADGAKAAPAAPAPAKAGGDSKPAAAPGSGGA